jgi:acyl-CoA dehydrogenase family protein 9
MTRDTRILSIFEGTNEILRLYVALSGLKGVGATLSELQSAVGGIFNDPIKGFGVLGDYAGRRVREATGYGTDRIAHPLAPELRKLAALCEKYTVELSKVSDRLLRKHGKHVAGQQHAQKRIADIAIDVFVGLCVLSRADSLVKQSHPAAGEAVTIAGLFARQARRRLARNVRGLERNEDAQVEQLAASVLERGNYAFDVL